MNRALPVLLVLSACGANPSLELHLTAADGAPVDGDRIVAAIDSDDGEPYALRLAVTCTADACVGSYGAQGWGREVDLVVWEDVDGDELALLETWPVDYATVVPDAGDPSAVTTMVADGDPFAEPSVDLVLATTP